MTTFTTGRRAEAVAADYLKTQGFEIIQQNYRTRFCEIDIVASKAGVTYFVEVKYRRNNRQGSGLEYITPRKLEQMQLAAEYWLQEYEQADEYQLAAIEVGAKNFSVTNFLESLT